MYPNAVVSWNNTIGRGARIRCSDVSTLYLDNCVVSSGALIVADHGGSISIQDTFIGSNTVIVARNSIDIRRNCQIAEMVVIRDQNHNFGSSGLTISEQGFSTAPIVIMENVWIGAKASVILGATIGRNAVIGAHSLVNTTVDADSVYAGTPARKIRSI